MRRRVFKYGAIGVLIMGAVFSGAVNYAKANDIPQIQTEVIENMTIEETKEILIDKGYTMKDMESISIFEDIEELKNDNVSDEEIIQILDDEAIKKCSRRGILDKLKKAFKMWDSLTEDEKKLAVAYPDKALAAVAIVNKSTTYTKNEFGKNGLGDKSDAFRHTLWCAMMSRDAGAKWALDFSTAHESGKTMEDLEKLASDGYKEGEHRDMDLHNNSVGVKVGDKSKASDDELIEQVKVKLTNDKNTGSYWLHD